jgi:predicted ATPase
LCGLFWARATPSWRSGAVLAREDLGRLIADSLHCEPERVPPLARLIHEKTAGNPFFAIQFISALAEEALLTFDHGDGRWSWDLSRIQAKGYTDNVVELMIGKLNRLPVETQKAIFEIVNQLNRGTALITSQDERDQIAELNLIAGKRAKASTAHASALKYLIAGTALLEDDCWERRHELTFALELHRAECEFLTGEQVAAAERLSMLSSRAANTIEQATVACLRVDLYTTLNQSDRAVAVCLDYLRHSGGEWSPHPSEEEARREYERI